MKKIVIFLSLMLFVSIVFAQEVSEFDINGNIKSSNKEIKNLQSLSNSDAGNEWLSIGPFGGDAVDLAIDPTNTQRSFVAAGKPYMRESDIDPWHIIDNLLSLSPSGIHCIEANSNGVIFAAGNYSYNGIYISTDGGATWQTSSLPVTAGITNIAIDPSDPDVIYIATSSNISVSQNKVILKSENAGDTWTTFDMTSILPVGWACIDITVDPGNNETLFALGSEGLSNSKAIASFDGGSSWSDVSSGLPSGRPFNEVTISNDVVYICGGQLFGSQYMGIYKSEDFGSSWTEFSANFPNQVVSDFIVSPDNPNKMYAATEGDGVYYTPNGGLTWLSNTAGVGNNGAARKLLFKPDDPTIIYAGFLSLGVCISETSGNDWFSSSEGIASLMLNDIEVDPNNQESVLASFEAENSGGCYLSTNGEWKLVEGLPGTRFSAVSVGIDGVLYAWSNGPTSIAAEGLYKSSDGGENWDNMGPNIGSVFETQIFTLALSETDPNLIFIAGNNFGANGWESMVYRTTNAGENWVNVYKGLEMDGFKYIYIDPTSNDQVIYAAYKTETSHAGFIKSTDGGDSWTDINNGIPGTTKWASAIINDPVNPETLYAGIGGYGGTTGSIYMSENGGGLWTPLSISLSNYSKISDLLISPDNSDVIYASTSGDGIFMTEDGENFLASNDGMPALNITGLSGIFINENDEFEFYCSTSTHSAFATVLYDPGTIGVNQNNNKNNQIRIFPNPSQGAIYIEMNSLSTEEINIQIYNANGQIIENRISRQVNGNNNALKINLNAGIYFIVITANGNTYSEKLIIQE